MLDKIILGTANFVRSYGILSEGKALTQEVVSSVIECALENNIHTYDTAFAYGDILGVVPKEHIKDLKIITKFSVLEDYDDILEKIALHMKKYDFQGYYGFLVHDPQYLPTVDHKKVLSFFNSLREDFGVQKIGVSAYEMKDVEHFNKICIPDIIQIPFNPLNQQFYNDQFLGYIHDHEIEVHGRSLFLQGVLLSDALPDNLSALKDSWDQFIALANAFPSRLHALLAWGQMHGWVNHWVLGVSSLKDLQGIIETSKNVEDNKSLETLKEFKPIHHPLADPRQWTVQ